MVDWKKVELPLPEVIKYTLALLTVGLPLFGLCLQVGSYKNKVDTLIEQTNKNAMTLYEQGQDINEIKMVLKIRSTEPPQSYTDPGIAPLAKEYAPYIPQVADLPSTFVRR
jgi:hypothetical protein